MISIVPHKDVADAAAYLGVALRAVGYSEDGLAGLGPDALSAGPDDVPLLMRRLRPGALATVVEALFLSCPVPRRDAVRALGRRGVDALQVIGFAEVGSDVSPRARIVPVGELLIAGDMFSRGREDPPDYVAPFSPTSRLCAALTPRPRVASALDVGTGSGVQALLAARHARRVVATDVNERALAYTRINASMNRLTNVECRLGNLFEPIGDAQFELITCNAPYVVSPERRWLYRDSGYVGDEISRVVVEGAIAHLSDGGFATLNVSWLAATEEAPDERLAEWIDTQRCEAWVLVTWEVDALDHAAGWIEVGSDDSQRDEALDTWTRYLGRLGTNWVSEGTVVLHHRRGRHRTLRIDKIDPDALEEAGEQVQRAFAARRRLSELGRAGGLLDETLAIAATLQLERVLDPRRRRVAAAVTLAEGTCSTIETTPGAIEVVARLDGGTLRDAVRKVAQELQEPDEARLGREALRLTRELLELGALKITSVEKLRRAGD
jgi:methylase of polypeptide subunit release factors